MPNAGPLSLLIPSIVLLGSIATLPYTVIQLVLSNRTSTLSSWSQVRHAWFKHFCDWFGPNSKPLFAPRVSPLLAQAKGIVLDIGPANGDWMDELAKAYKAGGVTKIYGVEPNAEFHEPLRQAAKKAGLADVYEVVGAKAQDLKDWGVEKGSVDTVLTVHVLCSVGPKADEITRALYEMLKPGGQWLVYEHVGARHGIAKMFQCKFRGPLSLVDHVCP